MNGEWSAPGLLRFAYPGPELPTVRGGVLATELVYVGGCNYHRLADPDDTPWVRHGDCDDPDRAFPAGFHDGTLRPPAGVKPLLHGDERVEGIEAYRISWEHETLDSIRGIEGPVSTMVTTSVEVLVSKADLRLLRTRKAKLIAPVLDDADHPYDVTSESVTTYDYFDYGAPITIEVPANSVELADLEAPDDRDAVVGTRDDAAVPPPQSESLPWASVSETAARFWFPVDGATTSGGWDLAETNDNALEYGWLVVLTLDGNDFEIGVTKFKFPGATPRTGSLADLLEAAQVNVWEARVLLQDVTPTIAEVHDDGILITLGDAGFIASLREHHPAEVSFENQGTVLSRSLRIVVVDYE